MFRTLSCVLSSSGPPEVGPGHAVDRLVEIGSLTKVLTGTALVRMEHAGLLGLDDTLERWLPVPTGTGITLRHLAEHTSGLPRLPPGLQGGRDPYADFDANRLREVLGGLDRLTVRPPGQEEEYSNFGYAVLGAALVAAGGNTYEELVREHVLLPLGISDVTARPEPGRRLLAPGLLGGERRPWTMDGAILPAGGMWATPQAAAELLVGLLVERKLGEPGPSWQRSGELLWHNGATRHASVFAGAMPDANWVLVHRLGSPPDATDQAGIDRLRAQAPRQTPVQRPGQDPGPASSTAG